MNYSIGASSEISENSTNQLVQTDYLPRSIQLSLILFAFFLVFPAIDIAGISITFFIFFFILFQHLKSKIPFITRHPANKWFILLFISGVISTIFHPQLDREVSLLSDIRTILQFFYWILLAMYIRSNFLAIDWWLVSKALFWGLIALIVGFYFLPVNIDAGLFKINFNTTRNGFVYNFLCFFPLIFWYLRSSILKPFVIVVIFLFFIAIVFTNGRAGFVLIIIQSLLLGLVIFPSAGRVFKAGLLLVGVIFILWQTQAEAGIIKDIARFVGNYNPRASALISREGYEGDLSEDKSWLLRRLMVDKSLEIVKEYPAFGIGWLHFEKYYAELNTLRNYPRLAGHGSEFLNTRSSHNSYAMYLAEGGLIGFIFLMIILIISIWPFFNKMIRGQFDINDLPLISLAVLMVYFYAITSITGANTWFIIGASMGCLIKND